MKLWKSAVVIPLFALLVCGAWPQNQPQAPANNKSVDDLGLQVQDQSKDQKDDQNHNQPQTSPPQPPAGEGARASRFASLSSFRFFSM